MRRTLEMLAERARTTGGHGYSVVVDLGVRSDEPLEKRALAKLIGDFARKRLRRLSVGSGKGVARIDRVDVRRVVDPSTTLGMFGL